MEEKLLKTIEKLKALSESNNENEASLALEKMKSILDKNGLTADCLDKLKTNKETVKRNNFSKKHTRLHAWEFRLGVAIGKLFDCHVLRGGNIDTFYNGYQFKKNKLIFIGTEEDALVAIEMYKWISNLLWDLSNSKSEEQRKVHNTTKRDLDIILGYKGNDFNKLRFKKSFLAGAVFTLETKVNEILEARKVKYASNETALAVINTKALKVAEKIAEINPKSSPINLSYSDRSGVNAGIKEGEKINLNNQIKKTGRTDLGQKVLQ